MNPAALPQISFDPLLPWPWLAALALAALTVGLVFVLRRTRGGMPRLAAALLILAVLAHPSRIMPTTQPLPDVAVILVDRSQSMQIGPRAAMARRALESLQASAGATRLEIVSIPPADEGGTDIEPALAQALANIQPDQLAGIVAVTDGEIDHAAALPRGVPFSALLTAKNEETDRALHIDSAPTYGLVGQTQPLTFTVQDHGPAAPGAMAEVTVAEDGVKLLQREVPVGTAQTVAIPVRHAGTAIITANVAALPGEVSLVNNQAVVTMTGIRKRLNVLLISGSPDLGERAWRQLLKSDPTIQLIHFTILRLPGELIDADPRDVALVPFPVRELFETDIDKFNLIILDGFNATGLLPPQYLGNIADFVRRGGALLTEVGPEFSGPDSLAFSPLGNVLPAMPAPPGTVTENFRPVLTALGQRHPVTRPFAAMTLPDWERMEAATPLSGDVLMTGARNLPLLILANIGAGRSGMLLSDQLWLWTRGGQHEGPALPLLRRIVHWLLREPALEAENLTATIEGERLIIHRQTLADANPGAATVTAPDGTTAQVALTQASAGDYRASLAVPAAAGVWKITQGGLTAYAAKPLGNAAEFSDLAATASRMQPQARAVTWLGRAPDPKLSSYIVHRHAQEITATRSAVIFSPLPTLVAALLLLLLAWWRERQA